MKRTLSDIFARCHYQWIVLLLVGVLPWQAQAQIKSSTLTGTVTDSTGSTVPGAAVTVMDQGTNIAQNTTTNNQGEYTVPYLAPGTYSVIVEKSGFETYRVVDIPLNSNANVRINATLKVGRVGTQVEVQASAAQLQTENSTVEGTVNQQVIQTIPNINSNPLYYATLQAGVFQQKGSFDNAGQQSWGIGTQSRQTLSSLSINGGQSLANNIQVDGVSTQGSGWNEASVLPNQEGLQEVRVQTNNYSAEYGRGQGVISFITKSGTNQFHGSLLYRHRNEALNANSFINNAESISRGQFRVHQWGSSLGGPIKKDKLFFFASYEGLYHTERVNWLRHVPTLAERAGDFSKTLIPDNNGNPIRVRLFDPFNVTQVGTNAYQRAEIPNAIIPNPDPYALKLMNYYPAPNRTPDDIYNTNNFYSQGIKPYRRDSVSARIDGRFGNHAIYLSGGIQQGSIVTPQPYGPDNPFYVSPTGGWSQIQRDANPYAAIGDTVILSPTLVLDVRYAVARIDAQDYVASGSKPFDYSQFGISSSLQSLINDNKAAPDYCPNSFDCLSYGAQQQKDEKGLNHTVVGSVTKTISKWTFKAGAEYRVNLYNVKNIGSAAFQVGNWWGQQNYTSQYIDASGNSIGLDKTPDQSGFGGASQLLGAGWISAAKATIPTLAAKYVALYSQNDYKVTSRLTINLGLRWDLQPGPTERYNHMASIDLNGTNPFGGQGAYAFPGTGKYSRNLWNTEYTNFAPRIGAALQASDKTVIRGGYGITYLPTNTGFGQGVPGTGYFSPYTDSSGAFVYGTGIKNGVPVGRYYSDIVNPIIPPVGADVTNPAMYGAGGEFFPRSYKNGRVHQWNFIVEHRFGNWLASLGYAATLGQNLPYRDTPLQSTQLVPDTVLSGWRTTYINSGGSQNPANDMVANPYQPDPNNLRPFAGGTLSGAQVPRSYLYQPYQLFPGVKPTLSNGTSNYQSMIASLRHGFSNGFTVDAYYTWSKQIDNVHTAGQSNDGIQYGGAQDQSGVLDLRHPSNNRMLSFNDIPHRLSLAFVYESPFGKGRPFLSGSRWATWLLGGWQVGGAAILQAGTPLFVTGGSGSLNGRPNRIPGAPINLPANLQHFYDGKTTVTLPDGRQITPCFGCYLKYNPDAFQAPVVQAPDGTYLSDVFWFGNAALTYGDMRSPGRKNFDASLTRSFRIRESLSLQLALNVYNVLNYANFQPTGFSLGSTNLVSDQSKGLVPGMLDPGAGSDYFSVGTYNPRQAQVQVRVVF